MHQQLAADSFASTPAGYITGIVVPIIAAAVAWLVARLIGKVDRVQAAMVAQTQALAVLVEQVGPMKSALATNVSKVSALERATAVLEATLQRHEAWAQTEHERILRKLP